MASLVHFVGLEQVQVDFKAMSGAVPILVGLGSSAADVLVSPA